MMVLYAIARTIPARMGMIRSIASKGVVVIKITDKAFRYTPSFNTDLGKKFRKLAQEKRAAVARASESDAALGNSVVPMLARRGLSKA